MATASSAPPSLPVHNYLNGVDAPQAEVSPNGETLVLRGALRMPDGSLRDICISLAAVKEESNSLESIRLTPVNTQTALGIQRAVAKIFRSLRNPNGSIKEPALGSLVYQQTPEGENCLFQQDRQAYNVGEVPYLDGDFNPEFFKQNPARKPNVLDGAKWIFNNLNREAPAPLPLSNASALANPHPLPNNNASENPSNPTESVPSQIPQQPTVPNAAAPSNPSNAPSNSSLGTPSGMLSSAGQGVRRLWNRFTSSLPSLKLYSNNSSPSSASLPSSSSSSNSASGSAAPSLPLPSPNTNSSLSSASLPSSSSSSSFAGSSAAPSLSLPSPNTNSSLSSASLPPSSSSSSSASGSAAPSLPLPSPQTMSSSSLPHPVGVPAPSVWSQLAKVPHSQLKIWTVPSKDQPLQPQQQKIHDLGKRTIVRQASFSSFVNRLIEGKKGTFLQNSNVTPQIRDAFDELLQNFENPISEDAKAMRQWLIDLHKQIKAQYPNQSGLAESLVLGLLCARKEKLKEYQKAKIDQGNDPRNSLIAALEKVSIPK